MAIGYPLGGVFGGQVVAHLLEQGGWRSVFYFGAEVTAVFLPLVFFLMPESVHWLTQKQPPKALERVNRTLKRMGHAVVGALPVISKEMRQRSIADIFAPALIATTLLCAVAYFFHVVTFYFIIKWIPKIVTDMGFTAADGARVLRTANIGGACGGAVLGLLALRFGVKPLTIIVMILSTVAVAVFGRAPKDLQQLGLICACAGFCTNAAIVGMYAIFAQAFPTHVRAMGTGFAIGVGRGGSVLAPIIAGYLLKTGYPLPTVAIIMGASALIAAFTLAFLKLKPEERFETESGAPPLPSASA
jgi:MFS family permease